MSSGAGAVVVHAGAAYQIDPDSHILMDSLQLVPVEIQRDAAVPREFTISVYPNPCNPTTTLRIEVPRRMRVEGEIVSVTGQRIVGIVDRWLEPGVHAVPIHLPGQSSGVYFVVARGEEGRLVRKVVLLR
jgi:hypothetical protein